MVTVHVQFDEGGDKVKIQDYRKPNYLIDPIYIRRWSPRAFLSKDITKDDRNSLSRM